MPIIHIVLFRLNPSLDEATVEEVCTRLLSLQHTCLHPHTSQPYILRASGGRDNSPEGLQGGFTHGFVIEFASKADRDYYVERDEVHRGFVEWIRGGKGGRRLVEEVRVVDYEGGVF